MKGDGEGGQDRESAQLKVIATTHGECWKSGPHFPV